MAEKNKGAAKIGIAKAKKPAPATGSEAAELASLLISTNRISNHLEGALSASGASVSLTDWLLLHTLNAEGPLPISKAANKVGVTRQRVHQQVATLRTAELLNVADADGKSKVLTLTPGGVEQTKKLEQQLLAAMSVKDGAIPTSQIHTATMGARRVVKAISPQREQKPE